MKAQESETAKMLEKNHQMNGLKSNQFIKEHVEVLNDICEGVTDHSVTYMNDV